MRVVIISKAHVVGTYQTKLQALAAYGDVDLIAVVPPSWRDGDRVQPLVRLHTRGYTLLETPILLNGRFHTHFYPRLPALLRHIRPDICHVDEEAYNLATFLAVRAARRAGARPLFFSWQNLLRSYPFPFGAMERYVHNHVDAAIAGTHAAADVLRQKGYDGRLQVIPQFGIDPDTFRPLQRAERDPSFVIGYAGRLVEEKGLRTLARAVAALQGPWRLHVCGAGPLRGEMEAWFAAHDLGDRVIFQDHVPSAEMPRVLNALDVLVLPSETRPNWKEQFGRILIEAMACTVPVVGSDSGAIPQVIGDAGLVFPEGDAGALCECLDTLQNDPGRRASLGQAGRRRALAQYTQDRVAERTVALYREMMQAR